MLCFNAVPWEKGSLGVYFFFFFYHFFYFPKLSRWSESISQYPRNPIHFLMTRVCSLNTDRYKTDFFFFFFLPKDKRNVPLFTYICLLLLNVKAFRASVSSGFPTTLKHRLAAPGSPRPRQACSRSECLMRRAHRRGEEEAATVCLRFYCCKLLLS